MMKHNYNGLTQTEIGKKLYSCWKDMLRRCYNPKTSNYKHYGNRNIKVCEEWRNDFMSFYKWALENGFDKDVYGKKSKCYSLDRIDNNADYEPSNCKFSSKREQNINKRPTTPNTSGYVGICRHSSADRWYGKVRDKNGKILYTGMSKDIIEAVKMRNDFIIKHNLDNKLNTI